MSNTAPAQVTSGAADSHPSPPSPSRTMPQEPPQAHDRLATDHTSIDARAFLMRALRWERRLAELRAARERARRKGSSHARRGLAPAHRQAAVRVWHPADESHR